MARERPRGMDASEHGQEGLRRHVCGNADVEVRRAYTAFAHTASLTLWVSPRIRPHRERLRRERGGHQGRPARSRRASENAAAVIFGPALWGMVNDAEPWQATTGDGAEARPRRHAAALHKGNGDYLAGDYGNFAQA